MDRTEWCLYIMCLRWSSLSVQMMLKLSSYLNDLKSVTGFTLNKANNKVYVKVITLGVCVTFTTRTSCQNPNRPSFEFVTSICHVTIYFVMWYGIRTYRRYWYNSNMRCNPCFLRAAAPERCAFVEKMSQFVLFIDIQPKYIVMTFTPYRPALYQCRCPITVIPRNNNEVSFWIIISSPNIETI